MFRYHIFLISVVLILIIVNLIIAPPNKILLSIALIFLLIELGLVIYHQRLLKNKNNGIDLSEFENTYGRLNFPIIYTNKEDTTFTNEGGVALSDMYDN